MCWSPRGWRRGGPPPPPAASAPAAAAGPRTPDAPAPPAPAPREASAGKQSGRTVEIQRLIGRSLRSVINLPAMGERQITIDCDVIQADGGTRTASITGARVALAVCFSWMKSRDMIKSEVLRDHIAAISCGVCKGTAVLDLDYAEDSEADTDANFVMTGSGQTP